MSSWIYSTLREAILALTRNGETELASNLDRLMSEPDIKGLQLYRSPRVALIADKIFDCDALEDLHSILKELAAVFGVRHCTVHCVRERSTAFYGTKVLTTFSKDWVSEYVNRRYTTIDPVVARCRGEHGVFFWDEMVVDDPMTKQFIKMAFQRGIGPGGVTYVEQSAHGGTIAVTFCSSCEHDAFRRDFEPKLSDFIDIAPVVIGVFSDLACEHNQTSINPTDD